MINTYGDTQLPASLDTLVREIEGTDKKLFYLALEVLRIDKNFWNISKNEVPKLSQFQLLIFLCRIAAKDRFVFRSRHGAKSELMSSLKELA